MPASYHSTPSGRLHPDSVAPAVHLDEKGRRYIRDGANTFAIRYDRDHCTERVYQPQDPVKPGIPVRLNRHGVYAPHDEVGLKGGAPGRDLQARLERARTARDRALDDQRQAVNDLVRINADIRRARHPDRDLQMRKRQAQSNLDGAKMTIAIEEGQIEGVRRQAQVDRDSMQTDLAQLRRHRDDGRCLERDTRRDIHAVETSLRGDHPPAHAQNELRTLQDQLQRILAADRTLDDKIANLDREIGELPRL